MQRLHLVHFNKKHEKYSTHYIKTRNFLSEFQEENDEFSSFPVCLKLRTFTTFPAPLATTTSNIKGWHTNWKVYAKRQSDIKKGWRQIVWRLNISIFLELGQSFHHQLKLKVIHKSYKRNIFKRIIAK